MLLYGGRRLRRWWQYRADDRPDDKNDADAHVSIRTVCQPMVSQGVTLLTPIFNYVKCAQPRLSVPRSGYAS
jgi:hypothetical protein